MVFHCSTFYFPLKTSNIFPLAAPVPDLAELVYLNESAVDHQLASSTSSLKNHNDTMDMADGLFESLAKANPALSSLSELSSKALDKVLDDLAQNLSESSDYFKLLVDVFRPFFRDPRHSHLRHFYVIVPPLTVNYVEHIVTCKEKLTKKNKQETSTFTDDGLAMGLAYCLSVLNQWKDFDALQWFSSVNEFFERERKIAGNQSQSSQDTLSLTLHRLDTYQQVKCDIFKKGLINQVGRLIDFFLFRNFNCCSTM